VRFTDTSTSGGASITRTFAAQTSGDVTLELKFQTPSSMNWCKFYVQSGSSKVVEMYTSSNNLVYRPAGNTTSTGDVIVSAYSANTWTRLKVVMHMAARTFDIYVNDVLKNAGVPFWTSSVSTVDTVVLGTGNSTAGSSSSTYVFTVDDVSVSRQ
jgi:hypothetical protein